MKVHLFECNFDPCHFSLSGEFDAENMMNMKFGHYGVTYEYEDENY